jgi:hypothetical protein
MAGKFAALSAALTKAAPVIKAVGTVASAGASIHQAKTSRSQAKDARRSQRALIAQQKEEQRRNAVEQRRELDEVNRKRASTQKSILGAMFQKTLSGSRTGVTRKFGGGN